MKKILEKYIGGVIGINLEKPFKIESAILSAVDDNFFTVTCQRDAYTHHFPFTCIVQVIENPGGVKIKHLFSQTQEFKMIIKVGHLQEYIPV